MADTAGMGEALISSFKSLSLPVVGAFVQLDNDELRILFHDGVLVHNGPGVRVISDRDVVADAVTVLEVFYRHGGMGKTTEIAGDKDHQICQGANNPREKRACGK